MMDAASTALWLLAAGADLIAKGRELWVDQGKDPDAYDQMVSAAREAREKVIDEQRAAELAKLALK